MNYIDFDEWGMMELRCMQCQTPLAVRSYKTITKQSVPPETVKALCVKRLNTYRRKRIDLEDGTYMEAFLCNECMNKPIQPKVLEEAISEGFKAQWAYEKRTEAEIKELEKKTKTIKIKRKKEKGQL